MMFWDVWGFKSKHAATLKGGDCPHLHRSVLNRAFKGLAVLFCHFQPVSPTNEPPVFASLLAGSQVLKQKSL